MKESSIRKSFSGFHQNNWVSPRHSRCVVKKYSFVVCDLSYLRKFKMKIGAEWRHHMWKLIPTATELSYTIHWSKLAPQTIFDTLSKRTKTYIFWSAMSSTLTWRTYYLGYHNKLWTTLSESYYEFEYLEFKKNILWWHVPRHVKKGLIAVQKKTQVLPIVSIFFSEVLTSPSVYKKRKNVCRYLRTYR